MSAFGKRHRSNGYYDESPVWAVFDYVTRSIFQIDMPPETRAH